MLSAAANAPGNKLHADPMLPGYALQQYSGMVLCTYIEYFLTTVFGLPFHCPCLLLIFLSPPSPHPLSSNQSVSDVQ